MKTRILPLSIIFLILNLSACSSSTPRITPGHLSTSDSVTTHTATITNIVQLSEKEAPDGKKFVGSIAGMVIGHVITDDRSDLVQDLATEIGGELGEAVVMNQYGKTVYRLTLALNNGDVKQIYVRGGAYVVGRHAKITVHKKAGNITSLVAMRT